MSPHRKSLPLLAALALAGSTAASPAATSHAATPAAKRVARVAIQGFAFKPAVLRIAVGTTVTWTNKDPMAHTVTAANGHWGSQSLGQGKSYTHTFTKAGTYTYDCAIHPSMTAEVIVSK